MLCKVHETRVRLHETKSAPTTALSKQGIMDLNEHGLQEYIKAQITRNSMEQYISKVLADNGQTPADSFKDHTSPNEGRTEKAKGAAMTDVEGGIVGSELGLRMDDNAKLLSVRLDL